MDNRGCTARVLVRRVRCGPSVGGHLPGLDTLTAGGFDINLGALRPPALRTNILTALRLFPFKILCCAPVPPV